jgi:hypothetical protein
VPPAHSYFRDAPRECLEVAVAADGTVAVTYYDFRNNTPVVQCS